jgi:hypothetical protein
VINLNGPNGSKQIALNNTNYYSATLGGGTPLPFPVPGAPGPMPLYLDPGDYAVDNGAGGADVGPFTATLTAVGPALTWTNADADLTIDRSAGVDIQWTGGDPAGNVTIESLSAAPDLVTRQVAGGVFICIVPNNGHFFVTSDVLSLMPATPNFGVPGLSLSTFSVSTSTQTTFTADGLDAGTFTYATGAVRPVVYK